MLSATTVLVGDDRAVAEWVRRQLIPQIRDWGPCTAIGIVRDDKLIAGVVYNHFRWPTIEASIASTTPAWCSRRNLAAIFAYPFRQLNCRRLGASTEITNQPARAFLCRLGFRQEGVCRAALMPSDANPEGDAVIYGMRPEECRWCAGPRHIPRQGNRDVARR